MEYFSLAIPFLIGLLIMINTIALPAAILYFIISFSSKDEEKKKEYRKISKYLLIPLLIFVVLVILWGIVGLIQSL